MRLLALCTLVTFSALGALAVGRPGNRLPTKPTIQRVQLYNETMTTGRITADLSSRKIAMIYKDIGSRPPSWKGVEATLTPDQQKRLAQLARSEDLRRFRPQSKWFKGIMPPTDRGSILSIAWSDKTVSFAIPSRSMRSKLLSTARKRYQEIDQITDLLLDLRDSHWESGPQLRLESNSSSVRAYLADRDKVSRSSQPRGRIGW